MNSFQIDIVVSLAGYLAIGWYAGRRVKDLEDFFVAGRNAPTILILGTLVASFMSTNAFMGEAGMSYQGHAPLIIMMTCFNCLGYVIGAIFFGRYLRRSRALTVPDFFRARFNSRRIQRFAGISIVVGLSAYLLAVTWGMALVMSEVTGIDESVAIVAVWLSYTPSHREQISREPDDNRNTRKTLNTATVETRPEKVGHCQRATPT